MWNKTEERERGATPMHRSVNLEKARTSTQETKDAAENSHL